MNSKKVSATSTVLIVAQGILFVWLAALAILEIDYIGAIQIVIGIAGIILAAIDITASYKGKFVIAIVLLVIELMVSLIWSIHVYVNNVSKDETMETNEAVSAEEVKSSGGSADDGQNVQKTLKNFELEEDIFLKELDRYTNENGTEGEKIEAVFEEKLTNWMEEYDSLNLGSPPNEYNDIREKADEIYLICCVPQKDSKYLQDKAVESYGEYINEIEKLYESWKNPELKKELASIYSELGDLYQTLGKGNEARDSYLESIRIGWDGVKESMKYGMPTNAKEIFKIISKDYDSMSTLDVLEQWDCNRAKLNSQIFEKLADNFNPEQFVNTN